MLVYQCEAFRSQEGRRIDKIARIDSRGEPEELIHRRQPNLRM